MVQELRNSLKAGHELHWYSIERVLGQGGFGITYLAHDPNLDQKVAIKEYLPMELAVRDGDNSVYPASAANGERYQWGLDRFIAEARTLAKFKHPAIVRVLSVFEANNTAYMVMEYEEGESLQHVLDMRKTLDEEELIPILAPLLDGLEQIHATGFIHRDIKPANIYIRADQSPVLLDFGSARQALGEQTKSLTSIVSPGYAPFEQYYSKSDRQGPWTDIYSLAATMYRAISGIMPMDAIDRSEAILKAERDIFVSAGEIGHGRYSPDFMRALDHALQFSEKKRPQTIGEWRAELGIEARNSVSISRQTSQPLSKTRFDVVDPTPQDDIETQLADPAIPSVRNVDAASARVRQPVPVVAAPSPPRPPRRSLRWGLVGLVFLAVGAIAAFAWHQFGSEKGFELAAIGASVSEFVPGMSGEKVERLVAQGDRALAAGKAFEPFKGSAVDFYRRAAKIEPEHIGALQGIGLVADQMRGETEKALAAGDLAKAQSYMEILRDLPGQFLANENLEEEFRDAQAKLDANSVQQSRIDEFLNEAATDIAENRILAPSGNNALVRYRAIQMLDPDNAAAARGIAAIVARLSEEHSAALAAGDFELAHERLQQIEPLQKDKTAFAALQSAFESERERRSAASAQDTKITRLLSEAESALKANRLATPAGNNAIERFREVLLLDPQNTVAIAGIEKVETRYVDLARGAVRKENLDGARGYLSRARALDPNNPALAHISADIKAAEENLVERDAARTLAQEQARLAAEARQRQDQERMRFELEAAKEAAALEKRRRQEAEAKRLFELSKERDRVAVEKEQVEQNILEQKSTLVVEFDGFDDQVEIYGLKRREVRADMESRLNQLGYKTVLHHEANRLQHTRLFVVRFRANLNSASGVFSYAASLSLYDHVPVKANSAGASGQRPIWDKGTTGVASQTGLRRVREEYKRTLEKFVTEVGRAPGRL